MLVVCARCGRHTKPETVCFFCGTAIDRAPRAAARRLSRAGAFAAVAVAGIACGARTELGVTTSVEDASVDVQSSDVSVVDSPLDGPLVFYGGPFPQQDAGGGETDADAAGIALYGAPPPKD